MPGTQITDLDVTLLKGGVPTGPNKASAGLWPPVVPALASYTWSGADLAGFTASDFNDLAFGVQLSAQATGAASAQVGYVQMTITFTLGGTTYQVGCRQSRTKVTPGMS